MSTFKSFAASLTRSLVQRRKDLDMSQADLAAKIGVSEGLVAKWEGGFRNPRGFNLYCWARALACDLVLMPRPEGTKK